MTALLPLQLFSQSELSTEARKAIDVIAATLVQAEAAPESEARTPAHILVCALKSNNLLVVDAYEYERLRNQHAEMRWVIGAPLTSVRAEVVQLREEIKRSRAQVEPMDNAVHELTSALSAANAEIVALRQTLDGTRDENESLRSTVDALTKERDAIKAELEIALDDLRMERFPIDER